MLHIQSLTVARKASRDDESTLPAYAIFGGGGTAKADLIADVTVEISTFLWRKKFEPIPIPGT